MGSLFENDSAFANFFDTPVAIEAKRENGRTVRTTVMACVLDQGLDDPLSDDAQASRRLRIEVTVKPKDWTLNEDPQVGDVVTYCDLRYAVTVASRNPAGEWVLTARSV